MYAYGNGFLENKPTDTIRLSTGLLSNAPPNHYNYHQHHDNIAATITTIRTTPDQ
jgi:hypothetical protein